MALPELRCKRIKKTHGYSPACFRHVSTVLHGMIKDSPKGEVRAAFTDREPCPISEGCENEAVFKVMIPLVRKTRSKSKRIEKFGNIPITPGEFCDQCGADLTR